MGVIQTLRDKSETERKLANSMRNDDQEYFYRVGRSEAFDQAADLLEEAENS